MLFQSYVLVLQQKVYHKNQQLQGCPVPRWCRSFTSAAQGDGVILLGFQILCWHSAWGCTTWIYDTYWYMLIPWSGCLKVNISLVGIDCLHWRHTSWRQPQGYCSLHFTRNFLLLKGFPGRFTICSSPRIIKQNSGGTKTEPASRNST